MKMLTINHTVIKKKYGCEVSATHVMQNVLFRAKISAVMNLCYFSAPS